MDLGVVAEADGEPAELVGGEEVFGGVVGDVGALLRGAAEGLAHELEGAGAGFPAVAAELFGVDDVIDEGGQFEGLGLEFLGGQVAVGDDAEPEAAAQVDQQLAGVVGELDFGAMAAVFLDEFGDELGVGADTELVEDDIEDTVARAVEEGVPEGVVELVGVNFGPGQLAGDEPVAADDIVDFGIERVIHIEDEGAEGVVQGRGRHG